MPSPVSSPDYLVVGHVTHDILADTARVIGGTVSYAALTAAALHRKVGVVTSAGDDFDAAAFRRSPHGGRISITIHRSAATTTFRNVYDQGHRRQVIYGVAERLTPGLLPDFWTYPRVAHIGPVMGECDPTWVRSFSASTFVGVTPQGWMRACDERGLVQPRAWDGAGEVLGAADAAVLSIEDLLGDWTLAEYLAQHVPLLVVTLGRQGGVLFNHGQRLRFPALRVVEVDPTGAGDIFATVFFDALASGIQPGNAAHFAACLASRSVTRSGLLGVPDADDIAACRIL